MYVNLVFASSIVMLAILSVCVKDASHIETGLRVLSAQLLQTVLFAVVSYKVKWYRPVLVIWVSAFVFVLIYMSVLGHPPEFREGTLKIVLSLYPAFVGIFTGLMTAAIALFWKGWGEDFMGINDSVCSSCGKSSKAKYYHCPHCGKQK